MAMSSASGTKAQSMVDALPNGSRLSCGALKKDSFPNLRAPSASSAVRRRCRQSFDPVENIESGDSLPALNKRRRCKTQSLTVDLEVPHQIRADPVWKRGSKYM